MPITPADIDAPSPQAPAEAAYDPYAELADLRRQLDRDYVSGGELLFWFVGVTVVLLGMHFALEYWTQPGPITASVTKPTRAETTLVWSAKVGDGLYALLQQPADAAVSSFTDNGLTGAYRTPVRTYWLDLYAFGPVGIELDPKTAVAMVGSTELAALPPPADASPVLTVQLASLTAPVALATGQSTRALLVFPAHDPAGLTKLVLRTASGVVELLPVTRERRMLDKFYEQPSRAFFETADDLPRGR